MEAANLVRKKSASFRLKLMGGLITMTLSKAPSKLVRMWWLHRAHKAANKHKLDTTLHQITPLYSVIMYSLRGPARYGAYIRTCL
jgi:hypothetical protein